MPIPYAWWIATMVIFFPWAIPTPPATRATRREDDE